jgi:hypothetical protein
VIALAFAAIAADLAAPVEAALAGDALEVLGVERFALARVAARAHGAKLSRTQSEILEI